jgi:hypothetical protein
MVEKIEEEPTYPLLSLFLFGKTQGRKELV